VTTTIFAQTNHSLSFVACEKAVEHTFSSKERPSHYTLRIRSSNAGLRPFLEQCISVSLRKVHFNQKKPIANIFTNTRQNGDTRHPRLTVSMSLQVWQRSWLTENRGR
jgi:hypothetical protein